ncbi:transcriptional regulator [Mesorhizobium sp. L-8-10]|uniref:LysR family transcriptional regulator n=1 Tax=Mesorhizobium sp. L-8-10 TaxID=2744523 RepID=UPI0019254372|nr:LysR family transcriptional regulator [Mesorhizobium sp. L-8-10]BCH29384.1 transcriptional regulator [Mesorhizobium sp. L-8-10]
MQRLFASQATLHKLEIFCLVCQLQSVTRAAEKIGVAQPVVTAHLRFLEDKLGVRLFARQGRRVVLTEAGERALSWATEIVTRTREFERELGVPSSDLAGSAVLAASMTVASYSLPATLARFSHENPASTVAVAISNPQGVTDAVRSGACDFGVTILDPRHDIDGLVVERLWEEQLILIAAADFDGIGPSATAADLSSIPFVSAPRNQVRREIEEDALRAYGIVRGNVRLELGHPEAIKQAVRSHAGVAFVMETSVRHELAGGQLRHVEMAHVSLPVPTFLVYRRGKSFSRFQKLLLDFLREELDPMTPPAPQVQSANAPAMAARRGSPRG